MNLGWTVQIYNAAEALPNLVNPFFMLPLLAVLGLRARDLIGFTFLQFMFHLPVVLVLLWLFGLTFDFVPPVSRTLRPQQAAAAASRPAAAARSHGVRRRRGASRG